jgi:hypothetical protein
MAEADYLKCKIAALFLHVFSLNAQGGVWYENQPLFVD